MAKLRVLLLSVLLRLVSFLPLIAIQQLGALFGNLLWYSSSRMAKITQANIQLCFGHLSSKQQHGLARRSLVETGKNILETAHAWMAPLQNCQSEFVAVEGEPFVQQAVSDKRGLIFVIPHLGNWEMLNLYLGTNYPLTHMYQPSDAPELARAILNWRQRSGTRFVAVSMAGIKSQYTTLRAGDSIGAMPDQEPAQHSGEFADFFGHAAITSNLLPGLCQRTGARVMIAYAQRLPRGAGFKIVFRPVEPGGEASDRMEDRQEGAANQCPGDRPIDTQSLNNAIEKAVADLPEQYLWSYKRFRTRPAGEPEYYQLEGHPLSVFLQKAILNLLLWISAQATLVLAQRIGAWLGVLGWHLKTRAARVTRINVDLCFNTLTESGRKALCRDSMAELGRTLLETGRIWLSSDSRFQQLYDENGGEDLVAVANKQGLIVLIPPQGNREVTVRHLGTRYKVTEYYHPQKNTALDQLIRKMRGRMGIALLPHTNRSVELMLAKLHDGEVVTLCPDQQPRLRGGLFVPFFGVDALTTTVLPQLLRQSNARLICAYTERLPGGAGFRLRFTEIDCATDSAGEGEILRSVNLNLQHCIEANTAQYRWADKRFNIQPKGRARLYRF
ncbi:MAG: lysophospholipid acyltransferase family protein [Pseudomonadales bacterium]|jgi:KDO2-lipid IV(A) lauroyltransferase|nr:lysophospholipid acyltransferase family protein [Pseudomonadales bacterium]MDP7594977.1 lysophospholipid acyltransferase family protein [Pseudomonadales bacterium]HJN51233.1 lysophospholipid acyltransferase family protein [Pseudomonadales bacterium]|tara:strand:- start:121 stop:1962 length:1842 start_codon:yes stop_codon:yes gene_type:complete